MKTEENARVRGREDAGDTGDPAQGKGPDTGLPPRGPNTPPGWGAHRGPLPGCF